MKTTQISRIILSLLLGAMMGQSLSAASASEAAARIKERLAQIDDLKEAAVIGENNKGYLDLRGELGPRQASLVESENADRRILYESVAQRTGQTVEEVAQQRALQIVARARPGVWLQKPDGTWFRK